MRQPMVRGSSPPANGAGVRKWGPQRSTLVQTRRSSLVFTVRGLPTKVGSVPSPNGVACAQATQPKSRFHAAAVRSPKTLRGVFLV